VPHAVKTGPQRPRPSARPGPARWGAGAGPVIPVSRARHLPGLRSAAESPARDAPGRGGLPMSALCFGVDVGGAFTDGVLAEGSSIWRAKAPTTEGDIGRGVLAAAALAAERRGASLAATLPRVARFGLGTTAITNALASRTGRKVGLVTTAGFEE